VHAQPHVAPTRRQKKREPITALLGPFAGKGLRKLVQNGATAQRRCSKIRTNPAGQTSWLVIGMPERLESREQPLAVEMPEGHYEDRFILEEVTKRPAPRRFATWQRESRTLRSRATRPLSGDGAGLPRNQGASVMHYN